MTAGSLAITLKVTDAADWLARQGCDPHLWATLDFLFTHGRVEEALECMEDHVVRTAYARSVAS
jgi:hypothetical protein